MNVKKESLRDKILEYLSNNPSAEVKDIATYVQISKQALYYHIKLLTTQKKIQIVDSQFVNGIEKKFYSLNVAQDPNNTDNQTVLVEDDSPTTTEDIDQKKSPLPQISNFISAPIDLPIQFFCIVFTFSGHKLRSSKPFKSSSA